MTNTMNPMIWHHVNITYKADGIPASSTIRVKAASEINAKAIALGMWAANRRGGRGSAAHYTDVHATI